MSRALRFTELLVRRMPGFRDGGPRLSGLAAEINLVHGPNGSGKSTAARALQRLIWPSLAPRDAAVRGRFRLDGASWSVEVDGTRAVWECDGEPASPPSLPPAASRDRYLLTLDELLVAGDEDLAELIRVESAGGYDVPRAAGSLGSPGGHPHKLMSALRRATERRDAAAREAEALRGERLRLEGLRREREARAAEAARVPALERALALADARQAEAEAARERAGFPAAVAGLRGDEGERLDEWAGKERELRDGVARAEAAADAARTDLERTSLPAGGAPGSVLAALQKRLETLRRHEQAVEGARAALEEARARRERADAALGGIAIREREAAEGEAEAGAPALEDLGPAATVRLDAFLLRAERARQERASLESWLEVLDTPEAGAGPRTGTGSGIPEAELPDDALRDAVHGLRAWLRTSAGDDAERRRLRWLVTGSAALFGLLGVAAAALGEGLAVAAAAGVAAVAVLVLRPPRHADGRGTYEAELRRLGLAPGTWTEREVRDRLDFLERLSADRTLATARRQEVARVEGRRAALEAAEADLAREREALAGEVGVDVSGDGPAHDDLSLAVLAERIRQREAARADEEAAVARLGATVADRDEALENARSILSPYGLDPADGDEVAGGLEDLRTRRERHEKAAAELASAERRKGEALAELDALAARRADLLASAGAADEGTLRELAARRAAFEAADRRLELARRERERAAAALLEAAGRAAADALEATGPESLARGLEEARRAAARERELAEEIARIDARLEDARSRHDLEDALAELDAARAALADQRDRDVEAAVGQALAGWLESSSSDADRPRVFHRARELLAAITRDRIRLDLPHGREAGGFRAYDTVDGRSRSLEELSAGTRLQLLLAVRVAFIETQEHGAAPPLLLDEVLANCDDRRAAAIIDAAIGLARAGRQVFYFTAQADELARWRQALEGRDDVAWAEHALVPGAVGEPAFDWEDTGPAPGPPSPGGLSHDEYGALLGVLPFDPWAADPAGVHLWYLLEDTEALHTLLDLGITHWGQLDHFAGRAGDAAPRLLPGVVAAARRSAVLCQRFGELWRQGRGRPVDRAALVASGAVSDTFLDRVTELCEAVDGEACRLLEALERGEVPRFRSATVEELRSYFRRAGHLDDGGRLPDAQIRLGLVAMAVAEERPEAATNTADAGTGSGTTAAAAAERVDRLIRRLRHGPRVHHAGRGARP